MSSAAPPLDNTGVGSGPGPLRHPRPLTAAELHMQLEKEQEAVVNRLTRELSLLRQQSASVVSTTSSTSTGHADPGDQSVGTTILGVRPTSSRRHRSSSNLSSRSATTQATTATATSGISGGTVGTSAGIAGSTASGIAPPRDIPRDSTALHSYNRDQLSRQSSVASRRSEASSPSLSSSLYQGDHFPNLYHHRASGSISQTQPPVISQQATSVPGSARSSHIPSTARYEEAAHFRQEYEMVKQENEALRRRVRELERALTSRRQSETELSRRESVGTNASVPPTGGRGRRVEEDDEDGVNVGESAASLRYGGGQ